MLEVLQALGARQWSPPRLYAARRRAGEGVRGLVTAWLLQTRPLLRFWGECVCGLVTAMAAAHKTPAALLGLYQCLTLTPKLQCACCCRRAGPAAPWQRACYARWPRFPAALG